LQSVKENWPRFVSLFLVILVAAAIYLPTIISPPSLMDDSDAVEAQIARTMLTTHDWVTARLDGVIYLEKTPMSWWLTDISYKIFGFKDWAARIPVALTAIGLAWLTGAFARWAFGWPSGFRFSCALPRSRCTIPTGYPVTCGWYFGSHKKGEPSPAAGHPTISEDSLTAINIPAGWASKDVVNRL